MGPLSSRSPSNGSGLGVVQVLCMLDMLWSLLFTHVRQHSSLHSRAFTSFPFLPPFFRFPKRHYPASNNKPKRSDCNRHPRRSESSRVAGRRSSARPMAGRQMNVCIWMSHRMCGWRRPVVFFFFFFPTAASFGVAKLGPWALWGSDPARFCEVLRFQVHVPSEGSK